MGCYTKYEDKWNSMLVCSTRCSISECKAQYDVFSLNVECTDSSIKYPSNPYIITFGVSFINEQVLVLCDSNRMCHHFFYFLPNEFFMFFLCLSFTVSGWIQELRCIYQYLFRCYRKIRLIFFDGLDFWSTFDHHHYSKFILKKYKLCELDSSTELSFECNLTTYIPSIYYIRRVTKSEYLFLRTNTFELECHPIYKYIFGKNEDNQTKTSNETLLFTNFWKFFGCWKRENLL